MARNTIHGQKVPFYKTWWFWVIIILFLYGFFSGINGGDEEEESEEETQTQQETLSDIYEGSGQAYEALLKEIEELLQA